MKTRKVISTVLAGVLALSALPFSAMSASAAEGAYALGDVDMDGFVTAHDAAMVSRALYVDNDLLSDEQKVLADVNEDGKITQEDADWIHENQVYGFGQLDETNKNLDSTSLFYQMYYLAMTGAGISFEITAPEKLPADAAVSTTDDDLVNKKMSQLVFNLLDVDGDGDITVNDMFASIYGCAYVSAGLQDNIYLKDGRYDMNTDLIQVVYTDTETPGQGAEVRDNVIYVPKQS